MRDRGNEERRCSPNGIEGSLKPSKHSSRIGRALAINLELRCCLGQSRVGSRPAPKGGKQSRNSRQSGFFRPDGYIEKNSSDSGEMVN